MEQFNPHEQTSQAAQGSNEQLPPYDPSVAMNMADDLNGPNLLSPHEMNEAQDPPSEETVSEVLSDAQNMMDELPTVRHTEQIGFDDFDADEAILPDVTVKHLHGKDGDITLIEPNNSEGETAKIVIDNRAGEIFIDGQMVDESGAEQVAGVIRAVRNMGTEARTETGNESDLKAQQAEGLEDVVKAQPENIDAQQAEKTKQLKGKVIGQVNQFLNTKNGNDALKMLAADKGVELKDLQERIKTGDISVGDDTMRALNEFQKDAAKPGSDVWNTDPRNSSMLGGAAKESQQLLANVLKGMF